VSRWFAFYIIVVLYILSAAKSEKLCKETRKSFPAARQRQQADIEIVNPDKVYRPAARLSLFFGSLLSLILLPTTYDYY